MLVIAGSICHLAIYGFKHHLLFTHKLEVEVEIVSMSLNDQNNGRPTGKSNSTSQLCASRVC